MEYTAPPEPPAVLLWSCVRLRVTVLLSAWIAPPLLSEWTAPLLCVAVLFEMVDPETLRAPPAATLTAPPQKALQLARTLSSIAKAAPSATATQPPLSA